MRKYHYDLIQTGHNCCGVEPVDTGTGHGHLVSSVQAASDYAVRELVTLPRRHEEIGVINAVDFMSDSEVHTAKQPNSDVDSAAPDPVHWPIVPSTRQAVVMRLDASIWRNTGLKEIADSFAEYLPATVRQRLEDAPTAKGALRPEVDELNEQITRSESESIWQVVGFTVGFCFTEFLLLFRAPTNLPLASSLLFQRRIFASVLTLTTLATGQQNGTPTVLWTPFDVERSSSDIGASPYGRVGVHIGLPGSPGDIIEVVVCKSTSLKEDCEGDLEMPGQPDVPKWR
ncbi:hypothetical protein F5141DRAFT_1204419 [Pisolithus sp. B1]|nr:hypothetical protein F5141DRAFT_1204419 [Pisolithus sp. B1]